MKPDDPWQGDPELEVEGAAHRLIIGAPKITIMDVTGDALQEYHKGKMLLIQVQVETDIEWNRSCLVFTEVRAEDGETVNLSFASLILRKGDTNAVASSWTPNQEGEYAIRAFVITDLENPSILSATSEETFLVDSNKKDSAVDVPSPYSIVITDEQGKWLRKSWQEYEVQRNSQRHIIRAALKGGTLREVTVEQVQESTCLTFLISADSAGELWIELPSALFGSSNSQYTAFIDEVSEQVGLARNDKMNILKIVFEVGAEQIEIVN